MGPTTQPAKWGRPWTNSALSAVPAAGSSGHGAVPPYADGSDKGMGRKMGQVSSISPSL
jgi:hypothetical protein